MFSDGPFILLDDARATHAAPPRIYRHPVEIVTASSPDELAAGLTRIAEAQGEGLHAAGYLSYEAGLAMEPKLAPRLPDNRPCPLLWFGLFEDFESPDPASLAEAFPDPAGAWLGQLRPRLSRDQYDQAFDAVQEYIAAGDIYQSNLTFLADARFRGHPLALYAAIRERARAGYGGIVFDGTNWILSFSPELFFASKGNRITARPMKGTAARVADETADAAVREELRSDPKQRAENLMIVDLLRNDLSRVASPGTVRVPDLFHVETYPTIHQMTSTVQADLRPGRSAVDLLRQIFPCGSITGAPKIRAMEVIDELEKDQRGIYCGSIGRIDASGDSAFNVAIRTFFGKQGEEKLSIGLGSGIVADSVRGDEWRECLAKGRFAKVGIGAEEPVPVDLIETMAFDPAEGIARLEEHLTRMKASAAALEYEFDRHAARNNIQAVTFHQEQPAMVRLMLSRSGMTSIELKPLPEPMSEPVRCQLVPLKADAADYRLHHKTSDRRVYAADDLDDGVHPVFVDAEGYVTEGAIWNVFVERDGQLLTPPLSRGLLPGVLRRELVEQGKAVEADLRAKDLADGFLLGNSVRGLVGAQLP
ncbi:para-aminobenzoate synthetase / 4-amino-4-deoxychorismate lyase [Parasphingorhabdus marina DSM 22363]|uniref:Probable branched-chain-amino-acid aminotransferase n=1 Tax=Parasphingorhabdus marina DSM 22363 TaxID=1123272 RepID=A0A1N6DB51_9SPHN|nr:aminodeoxychorismate synthase component I [Parasphingorhabdus marina]SIN68052.1 para-aminobenzoate synthetase / 4-amino-4-deoxychorismate lyase [Parasphingorhabdus marina DSM 22363]